MSTESDIRSQWLTHPARSRTRSPACKSSSNPRPALPSPPGRLVNGSHESDKFNALKKTYRCQSIPFVVAGSPTQTAASHWAMRQSVWASSWNASLHSKSGLTVWLLGTAVKKQKGTRCVRRTWELMDCKAVDGKHMCPVKWLKQGSSLLSFAFSTSLHRSIRSMVLFRCNRNGQQQITIAYTVAYC